MRDVPIFTPPPPQSFNGSVAWVPSVDGEDACVDIGALQYATCPPGLKLQEGDLVTVHTVGQTLVIDGLLRRPAPEAAAPGVTAPDDTGSTDTPSDTTTTT